MKMRLENFNVFHLRDSWQVYEEKLKGELDCV